jgi:hypothetical protein
MKKQISQKALNTICTIVTIIALLYIAGLLQDQYIR